MPRDDARSSKPDCTRTIRTFEQDGSWFFKTREGELAGPFRDELEASTQLEVYIRLVSAGLLSSKAV